MSQAKSNPVNAQRDALDVHIDPKDVAIDLTAAAQGGLIDTVEGAKSMKDFRRMAEDEKFMADTLIVTFAEPRDENDFTGVRVGVNGKQYIYPRDQSACPIPRYVVEALARTRTQRTKTVKTRTADGTDTYVPMQNEAVTYPFSVIRDPRGQAGVEWLRKILQERFL